MDGRRKTWRVAAMTVVAGTLALGGCGIKSSPEHPPGTDFPRQYPAKDPTPLPKAGTEKAPATDTAPGGFPYEYPNRPPR